MPRIRSVHPDLHRDKTLASVSASAERTFVRLWCHMDDDGRAEDDPDLLKADLYPRHREMDADAIDLDLDELAQAGLIIRYRVRGEPFLSCKPETWATYQRPQKKQESKIPGPDQADPDPTPSDTTTRPLRDRDDTDTGPVAPVGEGRGEGVGVVGEREDGDAYAPPDWPRIVNDGTFTDQVVAWARGQGHMRNVETGEDITRWCLDLAEDQLGDSTRFTGAACQLVVEWVEKACGESLPTPARKHLVRLMNTEGPRLTFRAMAESVKGGAGLGPEYADDDQAIVKYARSCIARWRSEGRRAV